MLHGWKYPCDATETATGDPGIRDIPFLDPEKSALNANHDFLAKRLYIGDRVYFPSCSPVFPPVRDAYITTLQHD